MISEIILTPLMDMSFLLLTAFIITFPLLEQGISVNLPLAKTDKVIHEKSIAITLDSKGQVYINESAVTHEQLVKRLHEIALVEPGMPILVRADESLKYGRVISVVRTVREAGLSNLTLVTREP
jgi:biopolymer transport protein ExbD